MIRKYNDELRIATMKKQIGKFTVLITSVVIFIMITLFIISARKPQDEFNGQKAFEEVEYQVGLGPRTMGSAAHEKIVNWIVTELQNMDWQVSIQESQIAGQIVKNIIAKRGAGTPWVIIGSHYDSRPVADRDPKPEKQNQPVLGANDGASSVAILLELGRALPAKLDKQIWLVFFDAEDESGVSGLEGNIGADYFVSELKGKPDSVVILDMVGDKDLNIYMEANSDREINSEIWGVAKKLGYSQFIPEYKYDIIDDHIPFINAGIRAVDIIDFDFPYWHTSNDTMDKISADSLQVVGETVLSWLEQYPK